MNKAVFLDRDGTLNTEVDYLSNVDDLVLIENSDKALYNLKKAGFLNIVITNQSGIARGLFDINTLDEIHSELKNKLFCNSINLIDDIFYSPYHSEGIIEKYKMHHEDRKPNIGMIVKAVSKYNIDLSKSWFIGDTITDMKCADNAGLKKILVLTGYGLLHQDLCKENNIIPDFIANNIFDASEYILKLTN